MLEAIGKHAFLKEVKGLIDEEMPSLKKQEVFFGLFGLIKYPVTTKVQLQNISDSKKEYAERLSAKGVSDAVCDLLFEKYVSGDRKTRWEWLGTQYSEPPHNDRGCTKKSTNTTVPSVYRPDFVDRWESADFASIGVPDFFSKNKVPMDFDYRTIGTVDLSREKGSIDLAVNAMADNVNKMVNSYLVEVNGGTLKCQSEAKVRDPTKTATTRSADGVIYFEFNEVRLAIVGIESKKPSAVPLELLEKIWKASAEAFADGSKGLQCSVTQLSMYMRLFNCKFGFLSSFTKTWFVQLVAKEIEGVERYGIKATKAFYPQGDAKKHGVSNPGDISLLQGMLLVILWGLSSKVEVYREGVDSEGLNKVGIEEGSWKPFSPEVLVIRSMHLENAKGSTPNQTGGLFSFVEGRLEGAALNAVSILGGAGVGYKNQHFHGYKCFIKMMSPSEVCHDEVQELIHEADIYKLLRSLWGKTVPSLVFEGELEDGTFAVITTDEGESIANVEVKKANRKSVRKHAHAALKAVHSNGILHGDVALRNLVIDDNCNVKVIDFGRAIQVDPNDAHVQKWFDMEHKQLDSEFTTRRLDISLHYDEKRDSSLPKKRSANALVLYTSSTDDDSMQM